MKKIVIKTLAVAIVAGSLFVSETAISAARVTEEFAGLKGDPIIAGASGDRPGDQMAGVMKKSSSKKKSTKKKTSKAS